MYVCSTCGQHTFIYAARKLFEADYGRSYNISMAYDEYEPVVLVLTSDGIHDYIDIDSFEEILSENIPMQERLEKAWRFAKEKGSADDCSIIVMEK